MNDAVVRLKSLLVQDVMARQVVEIRADQKMSRAAEMFTEHEIAAAPIVDQDGSCIGILSATDFLKRDRRSAGRSQDEAVTAHMSSAVQTVSASAPLLSAARMMDAQHVHRLVVLDADERPIGVISTMDIVAALLNALDEVGSRELA